MVAPKVSRPKTNRKIQGMGERSQALYWLERARDQGDPTVLLAPIDPCLAPLRGEPRMLALAAAMRRRRASSTAVPARASQALAGSGTGASVP